MAKIDFDIDLSGKTLDPNRKKIQLRAGDFVKFKPPSGGEKVQVRFGQAIIDITDVFLAPHFPDFQTFKLNPPTLVDGKIVISFVRASTDPHKTLPFENRLKSRTFIVELNGQTVEVHPNVADVDIYSGDAIFFEANGRAIGKIFLLETDRNSPDVYIGFGGGALRNDKRIEVAPIDVDGGVVSISFNEQGGSGPGDLKPYP